MLLDIALVLCVVLFVVMGVVRGGFKTLLSLAATFFSFLISLFTASGLANYVYSSFVSPRIISVITNEITVNASQAAENIAKAFPDFINDLIAASGIDLSAIAGSTLVQPAGTVAQAVEAAIAPSLISILTVLLLVVIFVLLRVIFALIIKLVNRLFELPVLRQFNRIFGFFCGLIQGILIVMFVITVIKSSSGVGTPYESWPLTQEYIDSSVLFRIFYTGRISQAVLNFIQG